MATGFDSTLASLGIGRSTTSNSASVASAASTASLGQSDFLKLMTAQLKNQDPFSPVDNTQMVAQLAQFSSVAGISEINTTLKSIQDKLAGTSASDALAYVGHTVLTEGDVAFGRASGGLSGSVELDGDATDVNVAILSADGDVLRSVSLGAQPQGTVSYDWDGTTDSGEDAGSGPFQIVVNAQNAGKTVGAHSLVWAPVAAVSMPASGEPILTVPGVGQIPVSAVRQIG